MNLFKNLVIYFQDLLSFIQTSKSVSKPVTESNITSPQMRLGNILLTYNAPYKSLYPPIVGSKINSEIHRITSNDAAKVANLILANAHLVDNDVEYLAACIFQESKADPACYDLNLSESNGVVTFQGTDYGICQFSGYFLPSRPGMAGLTEKQMAAKAYTAEWSIPVMVQVMHDNLEQAKGELVKAQMQLLSLKSKLSSFPDGTDIQTIQEVKDAIAANLITCMDELNTTQLSHAMFLATGGYNAGPNGFMKLVLARSKNIKHPYSVAKWYTQFKSVP